MCQAVFHACDKDSQKGVGRDARATMVHCMISWKIRDRRSDSFYSSDMQKAAVAILLGMLICAGCGKHSDAEQAVQRARGHALPDLVFAANAPVFDAGGIPYAEAVWIDGIWKIHDGGVWRADCRSDDEIYKFDGGDLGKAPGFPDSDQRRRKHGAA